MINETVIHPLLQYYTQNSSKEMINGWYGMKDIQNILIGDLISNRFSMLTPNELLEVDSIINSVGIVYIFNIYDIEVAYSPNNGWVYPKNDTNKLIQIKFEV